MTTEHKPAIELLTTPPPDPLPPEVGIADRLKQKRKELSLTVDELSALTARYDLGQERGVSPASIFRYEKGLPEGSLPGAREIRLLCEALNISPNWLILGQEVDSSVELNAKVAEAARSLVFLAMSGQEWNPLWGTGFGKDDEHFKKLEAVKTTSTSETK